MNYNVKFTVNGEGENSKVINNKVSMVNIWQLQDDSWQKEKPSFYPENLEFVEYVQFMTATGGEKSRDLFKDPENMDVLDDYDFSTVVNACRNALKQNIKPFIKTGNIPMKYSCKKYTPGLFGVNIYAPADYSVYRAYIAALAKELVDNFGLDEVKTWKWGVFTEFENADWFDMGSPEETCTEYCKIYDYTVDALQSVIGEDVFVGAHSQTCSTGLWDERLFIRHCANGTNYCTGKVGTHISYLSCSFYDNDPNKISLGGLTLVESIDFIRNEAKANGLDNLVYGVDEGRLLNGSDGLPLSSRTVGQTYQAGYDAMTLKQMIDHDIDYFSQWSYLTGGSFGGLKTVSHHVASQFYKMVGSKTLDCSKQGTAPDKDVENDIVASYNKDTGKLYIMAYSFKREITYNGTVEVSFDVNVPFETDRVKVEYCVVDDDANFFDKWYDPDMENTTKRSKDSACIRLPFDAEKYEKYSRLTHHTTEKDVVDGKIFLETALKGNAVAFFVIEE